MAKIAPYGAILAMDFTTVSFVLVYFQSHLFSQWGLDSNLGDMPYDVLHSTAVTHVWYKSDGWASYGVYIRNIYCVIMRSNHHLHLDEKKSWMVEMPHPLKFPPISIMVGCVIRISIPVLEIIVSQIMQHYSSCKKYLCVLKSHNSICLKWMMDHIELRRWSPWLLRNMMHSDLSPWQTQMLPVTTLPYQYVLYRWVSARKT